MVNRPIESNAYEFVLIAALRAQQLMAGSTPRVAGPFRFTTVAQLEVAAGHVIRSPNGTAPRQCGWQLNAEPVPPSAVPAGTADGS